MTHSPARELKFEPVVDRNEALRLLADDHDHKSPIAFAERVAAVFNSLSSDDIAAMKFEDNMLVELYEQFDQALASLRGRVEMMECAQARLDYWLLITAPSTRKRSKGPQRRRNVSGTRD